MSATAGTSEPGPEPKPGPSRPIDASPLTTPSSSSSALGTTTSMPAAGVSPTARGIPPSNVWFSPVTSLWRSVMSVEVRPELKSSGAMACALCCHFYGYEMARAASIALLAAKDVGLGTGALSFTVAVGSPISAAILYLYARSIKKNGPRLTLLGSNVGCVLLLFLMALVCGSLRGPWGQAVVLLFYCFREIYVSLLSTQHWSFIASVLDSKASGYLVSFSGVVSVASAFGGCSVEALVSLGGVRALLVMAFLSSMASFVLAEVATMHAPLAVRSGAEAIRRPSSTGKEAAATPPSDKTVSSAVSSASSSAASSASSSSSSSPSKTPKKGDRKNFGFLRESFGLLMKHETLRMLFVEALVHQACANMLNMMFHDGLRTRVPLDSERAVLVGRFFASVNIAACLLQIVVLPGVLSQSTLPNVLVAIPLIVLAIVVGGFVYPCLLSVMLAFGSLKVLEYSVMTSATEMIYMPMGHDHRYLGKEVIRFFGHRMGKSGATLLLSTASAHFNPSMATQSVWSMAIAVCWSGAMLVLSRHLAARNDALAAADKEKEREKEAAGEAAAATVAAGHTGTSSQAAATAATASAASAATAAAEESASNEGSRRDSVSGSDGSSDEGAQISPQSPATLWTTAVLTTALKGGGGGDDHHEPPAASRGEARKDGRWRGEASGPEYGELVPLDTSSDEFFEGAKGAYARVDAPPSLGGSPMPVTADGLRRRRQFAAGGADSRATPPGAAFTASVARPSSRTFEDLYDMVSPAAAGGGVGEADASSGGRPPGLPSRASDSELGSPSGGAGSRKTIKFENTWLGRITGRMGAAAAGAGGAGAPVLVRVGSTHMSVLVLDDEKASRPVPRPAPLLRVGSSIFQYGNIKTDGSPVESPEPSPLGTPAAGVSANDLTDAVAH